MMMIAPRLGHAPNHTPLTPLSSLYRYRVLAPFLHVLLWVGLLFYFITTSDSGSFVDDKLAASGLSNPPVIQKVYWAATEGIVAAVLIWSGSGTGDRSATLTGLRAVALCGALPLTFLLSIMVTSVHRALRREAGDPEILNAKKFNTQLLDVFEFFRPHTASAHPPAAHATAHLKGLLCPAIGLNAALKKAFPEPESRLGVLALTVLAALLHLAWVVLQVVEVGWDGGAATLGWVAYLFFVAIVAYTRWQTRAKYGVFGSYYEDLQVSLVLFPFAVGQIELHAKNDGAGAPAYFAELDILLEEEQYEDKTKIASAAVQLELAQNA